MQPPFAPEDFSRLVSILENLPQFLAPNFRMSFVIEVLNPSPRKSTLLSNLSITLMNTHADAVSLVSHLIQFGRDTPNREVLTLLIRALINVTGEDQRDFLVGLFEKYELETSGGTMPVTILFMTANPTDTTRLRLDEEHREIKETLQKSRYRDRFTLVSQPALRAGDLTETMLNHAPRIAHFSGHGAVDGLAFEDDAGKLNLVDPDAVGELFRLLPVKPDVVVLNACYAAHQAKQIEPHVGCVIGMTQKIVDKTAIAFAAAFYGALAYGITVQAAYDLAVNQIRLLRLPGADVPILLSQAPDALAKKTLV